MIEASAGSLSAVATLLAVSFVSYVFGVVFRKWPDKVQEYLENIDGSVYFMGAASHRAAIETSGFALIVLSFAALLAMPFAA